LGKIGQGIDEQPGRGACESDAISGGRLRVAGVSGGLGPWECGHCVRQASLREFPFGLLFLQCFIELRLAWFGLARFFHVEEPVQLSLAAGAQGRALLWV
jgi:hypothetical protein